MNSNINRVVQVDISLTMPPADAASFDHLLILGPPPAEPLGPIPKVAVYSDLLEVSGAGYVTTGEKADPVGAAARIAFSQTPRPSRIFVANYKPPAKYNPSSPEPGLEDALNNALQTEGWYMLCPAGLGKGYYHQIAKWTEAQTKMFGYTFMGKTDPVPGIYMRSHGWCGLVHDDDTPLSAPADNRYAHIAAAAKSLAYPAGSESWNLQLISGITPAELSSTLMTSLQEGSSNLITRFARRIRTLNGATRGGEWIDTIRFRDWLQNDLQLRILEVLTSAPKLSYTDNEIALIHSALKAGLKNAQDRGGVAPSEYDGQGNYIPGFTTRVPSAASLTAAQRHSRRLEDVTFSARLAGAIHFVHIRGALRP